jgi:hypothetical protein
VFTGTSGGGENGGRPTASTGGGAANAGPAGAAVAGGTGDGSGAGRPNAEGIEGDGAAERWMSGAASEPAVTDAPIETGAGNGAVRGSNRLDS